MKRNAEWSIFEFSAKFSKELDEKKNCAFSPLVGFEILMTPLIFNKSGTSDGICFNNFQTSSGKSSEESIPATFNLLVPKLKSIKGVTLNRATKVYLNIQHCKVDRKQKKDVKNIFNIRVKSIDFSNAVAAIHHINKWVEKKTRRQIMRLMTPNDVIVDANVILASGLYFKGVWHMRFDPENTDETIFYLKNDKIVNVFLMNRKDMYRHREDHELDAQLLLLPFQSEEVHMLIVLPKRKNGLDRVLQRLADGYNLMAVIGQMYHDEKVEVDVHIPRFKIESEIDIGDVLLKLGMAKIFDKAVQKVVIHINEEGTEPKKKPLKGGTFIPRWKPRPIDFIADHPHLIVILCDDIPIFWVTFQGKFE